MFPIHLITATLVLITVGCSYNEAKTKPVQVNYEVPKFKKDFDALDAWLNKNVDEGYGYEGGLNLALNIRSQRTKEIGNDASNALSILEKLSTANSCDDKYLELIKNVYLDSGLEFSGEKRRVDLIVDRLTRKVTNCKSFAEKKFKELNDRLDKNKVNKLSKINRFVFGLDWPAVKQVEVNTTPKQWAYLIKDLAAGDPKNVYLGIKTKFVCTTKQVPLKDNFRYIYDTYLYQPCGHYNSIVANLMEPLYAIGQNQWLDRPSANDDVNFSFLNQLPLALQDGLNRYFICKDVIQGNVDLKKVLDELVRYDCSRL